MFSVNFSLKESENVIHSRWSHYVPPWIFCGWSG